MRRPVSPIVSILIHPNTWEWDSALVNDVLWEKIQDTCMTIPLKQGMEDTLTWHFESKWHFSLKSAYHILVDNRDLFKRKKKGGSSITIGWPGNVF